MPVDGRHWLALASLVLTAPAVSAQQAVRPLLLPTRDVALVYRIDGAGLEGAQKLQVTYTLAGERTRIDYFRWVEAKYPFQSIIFDRPANRVIAVQPERRAYVERPIGDTRNPAALLRPDMRFSRQATAAIAETSCVEWQVRPANKPDEVGSACVTEDGVVLRLAAEKPSSVAMTALAIRYGPPPEGVFDPPAAFTRQRP